MSVIYNTFLVKTIIRITNNFYENQASSLNHLAVSAAPVMTAH
jgi:hypothetical protein